MFVTIVMSAGLLFALIGGIGAWRGLVTQSWPTTEATLVFNALEPEEITVPPSAPHKSALPAEKRIIDRLAVTYRYVVEGVPFEGHKLEPWDFGFPGLAKSRDVAALGAGAKHPVSYDPRDPRRGYLIPGPSTAALSFLVLGAAMLVVGFLVGRLLR